MPNFSISQTAMNAHQMAIDTVANNIANANTPGFHRRQVTFAANRDYFANGRLIGAGVSIARIHGVRSIITEQALTRAIGDSSGASQRLELESQIEGLFRSGEGSLINQYSNFYAELSRLSSDPSQSSQRRVVLEQASQMSAQFRDVSNRLGIMKSSVRQQIDQDVTDLNNKIRQLVDIQGRISVARVQSDPNALIDERDRLINEIAEIIDVDRNELVQGGFGLNLGGGQLSLGMVPFTLSLVTAENGDLSMQIDELGRGIQPRSGRLGALLELHNQGIDQYQQKIDVLASSLITSVDRAHSQGVGVTGPFSSLGSTRPVTSVTAPLAQAGLRLPVSAGQLTVTVTGAAGERRTTVLDFDPATQSLTDLAGALNGVANLSAIVNANTGELKISADTGFAFDFAGRLETVSDLSAWTGTSQPRWGGQYNGATNGQYRLEMLGAGTVGQTAGLRAAVFDQDNRLVAELDVGAGYEPGRPLTLANGVTVQLSAGTVLAGESTTTPVTANADTGGLLAALGINSFFSGDRAGNISVNRELVADPRRLASSRTGDVSDASNLQRLIDARDDLIVQDQFAFEQFLGGITSEIGTAVRTTSALQSQFDALKFQYETERDAISGVDLNEEMVNLTKFQRAYEASLRVISTIDQMYQDILNVLR